MKDEIPRERKFLNPRLRGTVRHVSDIYKFIGIKPGDMFIVEDYDRFYVAEEIDGHIVVHSLIESSDTTALQNRYMSDRDNLLIALDIIKERCPLDIYKYHIDRAEKYLMTFYDILTEINNSTEMTKENILLILDRQLGKL